MILILDVHYGEQNWAAGLIYRNWESEEPEALTRLQIGPVEDYQPGEFYRRELPALLQVVERFSPSTLIIDGYVSLPGRSGLGAHLSRETGLPVLGIAKTKFFGVPDSWGVLRGKATNPLWVTSSGVSFPKEKVKNLPGHFRIPDWVRKVDDLARGRLAEW